MAEGQVMAPLTDVQSLPKLTPIPEQLSLGAGVESLQRVTNAKKDELAAQVETSKQNSAIATGLLVQNDETDHEVLEAMDNLQRISNLGGDNGITKIIGLFDHRYSLPTQKLKIESAQLKAQQNANRARTLMSINEQAPALAALKSSAASIDFEAQKSLMSLTKDYRAQDVAELDVQVKAAELRMHMGDDQRKQIDFAIKAMPSAEVKKELKLAQQGKGRFVGLEGLLEAHIDDEEKADIALADAKVSLLSKNEEVADKAALKVARTIPVDLGQEMLKDAQTKGLPFVHVGDGTKGFNVPIHLFMQGMADRADQETKIAGLVISNGAAQVADEVDTVSRSITALAFMDPEAARLSKTLAASVEQYNAASATAPPTFQSIQNMKALIKTTAAKAKEIATRSASTMPDAQSKAAVVKFGETGRFDDEGASALTKATIGRPYSAAATKFKDAFALYNNAVAGRLAQQNVSGMPAFDGSDASAAAIMSFGLRRNLKIDDIKDEVLADPVLNAQITKSVGYTIQQGVMKNVFAELAKAPEASPIWGELAKNDRQLRNAAGDFSLAKLAEVLEQQSTLTAGKMDFNGAFVDALRRKAMERDPGTDSTMSIQDQGLMQHLYSEDGYHSIMSDFVGIVSVNAQNAHDEMMARVKQDTTGRTQAANAMVGVDPQNPDMELMRQRSLTAPSATGIPTTADRIKSLYGR